LIPIDQIDFDPDQPRREFDQESLAELAASIQEYGVLCPILVRVETNGRFMVVAGERRLRASKLLALDSIPAMVDSADPSENTTLAKQLVENLQREDLNPLERSLAIGQLRDKYGWSVREIAKRLGISKTSAQRSLEILELPDDLQSLLQSGASESKVMLLTKLPTREMRSKFISMLDDLTRVQLDMEIEKELRGEGSGFDPKVYHGGTLKKPREKRPEDKRLEEELQRSLGTKVEIVRHPSKEDAGRLTVEFFSREDLSEIYRRLSNSV
jgi:ParB family chromosome partitioning protein